MDTAEIFTGSTERLSRIVDRLKHSIFVPILRRPEMLVMGFLILLANGSLLTGSCWNSLMFEPAAVNAGQWWRLLTHPLVHVTWYHLLLDGSAFFILYHSLLEKALARRLGCVVAAAAGSLLSAWWIPGSANGLCGLSGIAHGLMAVSALELVSSQPTRSAEWRVGLATFGFVLAKAGYEAVSGRMFFAFLDFGLLGSPVAVSHAGGIIGALAMMLVLRLYSSSSDGKRCGILSNMRQDSVELSGQRSWRAESPGSIVV